MKDRNMEVKNNVDEMIFQVLNYIAASKLDEAEAELLVNEMLSTIFIWNCEWDPENIDILDIKAQLTSQMVILLSLIPDTLEKWLKNME